MAEYYVGSQNRFTDGPYAKVGFIPLSLTNTRLIAAAEIPGTSATLFGGVISNSSTPKLEGGGLSGTPLRINWASSGAGTVAWEVPLPPDLDTGAAVYVKADLASGGTVDTPGFAVKTSWGGTAVISDTLTQSGTARAVDSATIAAADIAADVRSANVVLVPGAHTTDTLLLYGLWLEYTKL
jgi:hypothetical protein